MVQKGIYEISQYTSLIKTIVQKSVHELSNVILKCKLFFISLFVLQGIKTIWIG